MVFEMTIMTVVNNNGIQMLDVVTFNSKQLWQAIAVNRIVVM